MFSFPHSNGSGRCRVVASRRVWLVLAVILAGAVVGRAADFTVLNTNNAGAGSLREAILGANSNAGPDRVVFQMPGVGQQIIGLTAALPDITDPLEIDGYSQPGTHPNTLRDADNAKRVQLDGVNWGFDGLVLATSNSVVRGLWIRRANIAIWVQGSGNRLVGNQLGSDSSILHAPASDFNDGNSEGLHLGNCCGRGTIRNNIVGGILPAERNVIAGNNGSALRAGESGEVEELTILGNFLGVDSSGVRYSGRKNSTTVVFLSVRGLQMGGLSDGARNVIASDSYNSISIRRKSSRLVIQGNYIGVGADGITPFPSFSGMDFQEQGTVLEPIFSADCLIEGNRIANSSYAIYVWEYSDTLPFTPQAFVRS